MSVLVNYKGEQIASVEAQQTKTLETQGKYCEGNIILTDNSNPVAEENDVIFIDYDGTIRYSYSAAEFAALSALPANPVHDRLTSQGWNWTLADAKAYVQKYGGLVIGQSYISKNGKTRIYITLSYAALSPKLLLRINGSVDLSWGDGTTETVTGTAIGTNIHIPHEYATPGDYVIEFAVTGLVVIGVNNGAYRLLSTGSSTGNANIIYASCVTAVELGANVEIDRYAFTSLQSLKYITLPSGLGVRNGNQSSFIYCASLQALVIPTAMTESGSLRENFAMKYVAMHKNYTVPGEGFRSCYALARATLPETASLPYRVFYTCYSLKDVQFPDTLASMSTEELYNAYSLAAVRLTSSTPPTVSAANSLAVYRSDCKFYVPFSGLAAYLTATSYPSPSTYTYIGFATYANGVTLPTQDSTQAYNVVWYATRKDAINEANPISTGNGKEIYCRYTAV